VVNPSPGAGASSSTLANEVRTKVRERGLVVWLDAESQYSPFVDTLDLPYPIVRLRGSYLDLMLALEPYANGLLPEHVLVHLPGLNKESVKETPVYELYKAGVVFEKNLVTLVREAAVGIATPDELDAFVRSPGLTLQKADEWLESLRSQPTDKLSLLLSSLGVDDVVMGLITEDPRLRAHLPEGGDAVLAFLHKNLALDNAWRRFRIGDSPLTPSTVSALTASWLMAVEFVSDLKEPPATPALAPLAKLASFTKVCRLLANRLRQQHPDTYESAANDLQELLEQERTSHHAQALGAIDTFRFEEATVRAAAIVALAQGEWDKASNFASDRIKDKCFWVQRSPALQRTWEMIRLGAATGQALAATRTVLDSARSVEEAVERYAEKLAPVDRHHRIFEQRSHALLASDLEDYDALLEARQSVRRAWRDWANATNRRYFTLCKNHGPLPSRSMRQRSLYEDVVHPLADQGQHVAYFLVDALRFEMAQGLALELAKEKYSVHLTPRLAELPTETAVGMNVLAPVERENRLRPVIKAGSIKGFMAGEVQVCAPADRVRTISQRSLGSTAEDIELEQFQELSLIQLKRRLSTKPKLVIVRSREIDTAGEHGLHLGTFHQSLALIKSALSLLQQAGVDRFVITADHGFLLQDATTENIPFGVSKRVPHRRHALLSEPSGMPDVLELRLSSLDYDVAPADDDYLVFRPDTALWQTRDKISPYAHGGNSLQERVIPVLLVERHVVRGKTISKYEVVARAEPSHLGRQRLRVSVRLQNRENASLGFASPKSISLALRIPTRLDVAITLLDVGPPASMADGRVLVPPNSGEALVEFELEGMTDEKVRVEIFHPDAVEDVTPKMVEGFFEVARNRRLGKQKDAETAGPQVEMARPPSSIPPAYPSVIPPPQDWADQITDPGHRQALEILAERRSINEVELEQVLGSSRKVRAFSRQFDDLLRLLPFGVEISVVGGLKVYARKD
jgi:hypothetical protein